MDELRLEFGHWGESSRACGMIASYKNSTKKREDFEVEVNDTLSLDRIPVSARFKKDSCYHWPMIVIEITFFSQRKLLCLRLLLCFSFT